MAKSLLQEWSAISQVVTDIADVGDLEKMRLELQRSIVSRLISADDASVDEFDYHNSTANWITINPLPGYDQRREVMNRRFREHPFILQYETATQPVVKRLSDTLPVRLFERCPLFEELYRPMGVRYQLTLGLTQGVRCYAMTLHRATHDFSERDINALQMAATVLVPLFKSVVEREQWRIAVTVTSAGRGFIYLQSDNSILWANNRAWELLDQYFEGGTGNALPAPIFKWLRNPDHSMQFEPSKRECGKLKIHFFREKNERLILMDQTAPEPTPQSLQSLGLTPRQAEVLFWIARGKTNSEIGVILGTSVHTINRHAEGIYSRLHVESRAAAAVCARKALGA